MQAIANHMEIDKVAFTGSTEVGQIIQEGIYSGIEGVVEVDK